MKMYLALRNTDIGMIYLGVTPTDENARRLCGDHRRMMYYPDKVPSPLEWEASFDGTETEIWQARIGSGFYEVHSLPMKVLPTREMRIAKIEVMGSELRPKFLVTFGDGSGMSLDVPALLKLLDSYHKDQEEFIAIMEYNRSSDPRTTGEWDEMKRRLDGSSNSG